jgi:hypothetical protein
MPRSRKTSRWKGEGVEPSPDAEAEHAADRAAGRVGGHGEGEETLAQQPDEHVKRAPSGEEPDEKIEDWAEAHRERPAPDAPTRVRR